jgi:flagellar hook-length control protein FliK
MIQQLSAKPCAQDMQQAMVRQAAANTTSSGEFRSMLLKTAQSAKDASSTEASGSAFVPNAVSKDRPDEDSPPSLSGDRTQTALSQAMLLAAQQAAAGEMPSGSVPDADTQALQSASPAATESLQAQRSVAAAVPGAAENLQAQQAAAAAENLQALSEVSVETQTVTVETPAQAVPAAQAPPTQTVFESATAVQTEQAMQTAQTVQKPQTASQTAAADMEMRQSITGTEAELHSAAVVRTSGQTSDATTEPIADAETTEPAARRAQPLDADIPTGTAEEPILSLREEKDASSEKTPALASRPAAVPYSSEKVVVRISDTPAAAKAHVAGQVADAVVQHFKTGKHQFQVDLYPQSLGKVSVKLVAENGTLTIEIAAANPKTQSLLASSSGEIRSLLQASTGQTVEVTVHQPDAQQYTDQSPAGQQQQEQSSAQQQQQQEEAERRRMAAIWYASNSSGFSAADFLTMLQTTAAS